MRAQRIAVQRPRSTQKTREDVLNLMRYFFKLTFWVDVSVYGSAQVSVRDWVAKRLVTVQRIVVQRSQSTLKTREDVLNLMR